MLILLSAFNGIEHMVAKLYTAFDAPITIQHKARKTFLLNQLDDAALKKIKGVKVLSKEREELIVLRKDQRWINATLHAVDPVFIKEARVNQHLINNVGAGALNEKGRVFLGSDIFSKLKLGLGSDKNDVLIYVPKQNLSMRLGANPFNTQQFEVAGALNYNQELNSTVMLCNFDVASSLFDQEGALSRLNIYLEPKADPRIVQQEIQELVGSEYKVRTQHQKNELIYKTSKSERLVVFIILVFVFMLAAFNLIAALTMLIHEKKENFHILKAMGLNDRGRFMVFFIQGQLLTLFGVVFGLFIGFIICWSQQFLGWLIVPGANVPFPIVFDPMDIVAIIISSVFIGLIFTYFPTRFLMKKTK